MQMRTLIIVSAVMMMAAPEALQSQRFQYGIIGQRAPKWKVAEWYNLPEGTEKIEVTDFTGKIVYLFSFQSWCPGCHAHGFPALKYFQERYQDNDDVVFIAIQTVFEGFETNTAQNGWDDVKEFGLDIPMGHDPGPENERSIVMQNYKSGGTPWTVIIDRKGIVRYNDFSIRADQGITLIDRLISEKKNG